MMTSTTTVVISSTDVDMVFNARRKTMPEWGPAGGLIPHHRYTAPYKVVLLYLRQTLKIKHQLQEFQTVQQQRLKQRFDELKMDFY